MRFTTPLSAITLMVASVKAAENPIIGLVDRITSISQDFDNALEDPNPVRIIETLPHLAYDGANLVATIVSDVTGWKNPLDNDDQLKTCATLKKFATTEEKLLTAILNDVVKVATLPLPIGGLIGLVASALKEAVDGIFGFSVKIAPVCSDAANKDKAALTDLIANIKTAI
ncbi:hypothetical protein LEL_02900 [Akanthomyces lecanii RCEF 1005]|uniref:Cell wall galactomannoprotein n=1 Tax=Akanthomyces lecanii RCEF 1005 TaxID=1081108 RepID=A0A168ILV2_CORDF|nr:hypothetical protein LEL_02900 [Akanthomyces lecanii RCEF 1005]